ncbi:MAG: Eco57I restriction-modification methylase domain-containing protein, partial [Syntrophaceae bacterium]|nr:Eco57I restriction-modification methylase domain-containing protein [Syntrophaceae bacterium]
INPDVLGYIFEKYINQKQMGAYYTKEDITGYISKNTIIPYLFDAAEKKCAIAFQPDSALWRLLRDDPDRYIYPAVRKGVVDENGEVIPLPAEIEKGIKDVSQRGGWNRSADPDYALPTEIWREHVARRQRCFDVREKLKAGEIHRINELITYNLDIRQFVEDVISGSEGPELLRAFYKTISTITVLDPTCGSGAFLFAALNILEPLYEACLDRMQGFVDDLDRSGERHRPEKFSDFRKILADIERHPNRRYFILKSIIVNNLYGVDIMQEAVEICKLRLFLKLVAQVDKVKHLEPLPDIDFNIRAGNTLVGFATLSDVRQTLDAKLAFYKDQVDRIVEEAGIVELAFKRFHEMQITLGMNANEFAGAKKELRAKLKNLTDELDQYLAIEYGIDADKNDNFQQWRENHQPFHWFAEFYGILRNGGFNVVIGNPPYVEYRKVKDYSVRNYLTFNCKDLYAFVMERSVLLMETGGHLGMIVPVSIVSTDGFEDLRAYLKESLSFSWSIGFAERPSKLFTGVEKRLSIWLTCRKKDGVKSSFFSKYYRWLAEERGNLFSLISFVHSEREEQLVGTSIPKVSDQLEIEILSKLSAKKPLGAYLKRNTVDIVYYTRKVRYFVQFFDFIPKILDEKGRRISPSELKFLYCDSKLERDVIIAILNSSLFFWFYSAFSDVRNVNRREILDFPCSIDGMDKSVAISLQGKVRKLMHDFEKNSIWIKNEYKKYGKLSIQSFQPRLSKPIIDDIDKDLSLHYGMNDTELDFIKNFDHKYRMGH